MINIEGIDKALVLVVLYNNALSINPYDENEKKLLSIKEARELLQNGLKINFANDKKIFVDFKNNNINCAIYDYTNNFIQARAIINNLKNSLKDEYFVIATCDNYYGKIAKYNKDKGIFYDIKIASLNEKAEIGQKVICDIKNDKVLGIVIEDSNKQILNVIKKYYKDQKKLSEIYSHEMTDNKTREELKKTRQDKFYINGEKNYLAKRYNNNEDIDEYIQKITFLIMKLFNVKIDKNTNFKYDEEIQLVAEAIYDTIYEYLSNLNDKEKIYFCLCNDGLMNKKLVTFMHEIEKKSGFKISPEILNKYKQEIRNVHISEDKNSLNIKSHISITKNKTIFRSTVEAGKSISNTNKILTKKTTK